jgi:Fur family transcriptional regulator, ferric uptake regulator
MVLHNSYYCFSGRTSPFISWPGSALWHAQDCGSSNSSVTKAGYSPLTQAKKEKTRSSTKLAEARFRSGMKEHGLRCTSERIAVLQEIYRSNTHLDADELFVKLKNRGVGISRATVYHTLDLLMKFRLVSRTDLGHKHTHYEKAYGVENHLHMICNECGNVIEITDQTLSETLHKLSMEKGFEPESFTLQLFGRCSEHRNGMGKSQTGPVSC